MTKTDATVVARLTPAGSAALATIAISGPNAITWTEQLFQERRTGTLAEPGRVRYGLLGDDQRDDVVVRVIDSQQVEIHCHGGPAIVAALLHAYQNLGATLYDWQAYLQLRGLTPVQIEAQEALSRCATEKAAAVLLDQFQGALDRVIQQLADCWNESAYQELLRWRHLGLHLIEPMDVLLLGRPNAGKSSLLNALAGYERAIVTARPGTTRDLLEADIALAGWPVRLRDGAGLRNTADALEAAGQTLLTDAATAADLRVLVVDPSIGTPADVDDIRQQFDIDLIVGTHLDRPTVWNDLTIIDARVDNLSGKGLDELRLLLRNRLIPQDPPAGAAVPFAPHHWDRILRLRPKPAADSASDAGTTP